MIDFTKIKHWIFDLDGTLTVKVHDFMKIREQLDVPYDKDILGYLSLLPPEKADPRFQLLNEIEIQLALESSASKGAVSLVKALFEANMDLGILTRNTRKNACISLEKIGMKMYFPDECVFGRENIPPKPDPEGIYRLMDIWGGSVSNTVMVGDYLYDLQAGKNAGTYTIHVDTEEIFPWEDLSDLGVPSLKSLHQKMMSHLNLKPE